MASEEVKTSESAASTIVNLSEEAKLVREGVKTPGPALLSICKSLFAGGAAGGVSRTTIAPLERLKILLQVQNPHSIQYNGTIQGLKYIWRTEGLRGMFKGNGTNCARIVPNSAVKFFSYEEHPREYYGFIGGKLEKIPYVGLNFAVYESLKDWLLKTKLFGLVEDNELGVATRLACGAAAGTAGQTVAYPLDVIRRRKQWKTVRHEGFGALYKGLVPNSVKVIPSIAIAFVTYEMVKVVLGVEMRIFD
ncbi:hypothetical protein OIU84_003966 [Salix udensis]|uniref:Mitochondrial carrier protein n=1 Tax=Salix udensis TaxID=889485 RepID=A0AAD6K367_9ROSI|nr:hypothetical protein OIU84_003966 [Salix udensis]